MCSAADSCSHVHVCRAKTRAAHEVAGKVQRREVYGKGQRGKRWEATQEKLEVEVGLMCVGEWKE